MWERKSEKTSEVVFSTSDPTAILSGHDISAFSACPGVALAKADVSSEAGGETISLCLVSILLLITRTCGKMHV